MVIFHRIYFRKIIYDLISIIQLLIVSECESRTGPQARSFQRPNISVLISSLANKSCFVNSRNSRLTYHLIPSLENNARCSIICCSSLAAENRHDTVETLLFGQRAKNVKVITRRATFVPTKDNWKKRYERVKAANEFLQEENNELRSSMGCNRNIICCYIYEFVCGCM